MKTIFIILFSFLLYVNTIAQNAATTVWTDAFGLQDTVLKIPTAIDNLGNLYVAGSTINGGSGPDILIKKYDSNGDPIFGLTYTSAGNNRDQATTINIDNNYNIIIGGFSYVDATNSYDFLVLKYDSAGTLLWTYTYNGTGSAADLVSAIALESSNIYVTGASVGISSLFDFTTIKLNSAGSVIWNNRYNYLGSDLPFDIDIIDTNIYVNGGSQSTITNWDYALLHYSTNGTPIDTIRTTGTGIGFDRATQAVTDNQGYIYITGTYATTSNGLDYKTIMFEQQGNVKWIATFDNSAHQDDIANAIAVDYDGNVFVTGKTFNSLGNFDYCTIKYDSLGTSQWTRFYDNKYDDEATNVTVDANSNIYITGSSSNIANKDFTTIGYGTAGDTLWTKRFNGAYNGDDEATSIIEKNGFVYVSGQTQLNSTQYKNITIAYGQAKIKEIPDLLGEEKSSNLFYIPNEGQLANDTGAIASDVLFYVPNHYPSLFVNHHGLSYVFKKFTNDSISNDTIHRIDMQFMKGNYPAKAVVYPNKITSDYFNNYYLPHCSNGVIDVRGSNMLFAKGLYEGIDLYYSSNLGGEKHYIVLAPNANPKAIKIKFNGADSVSTPQGKYTIHSSIGKLEYDSLVAYEIDAIGNIIIGTSQPIQFLHDTTNNTYSFKTFSYNTSNTLVIMSKQYVGVSSSSSLDNITYSTYFGGVGFSGFHNVVNDDDGNTYLAGGDFGSNSTYPTTIGAYSQSSIGNWDIVLTSLNADRSLNYSTYFGGGNVEEESDMIIKDNNFLYLTGGTNSTNFPILTNSSAYNDSLLSPPPVGVPTQPDAFILKIETTTGYPLWSAYLGGNLNDKGFGIDNYSSGYYIVGTTSSTNSGFPLQNKAGAYFDTLQHGSADMFITQFDDTDNIIWSTKFGGDELDQANDVKVNSNDDLFIVGSTRSTNLPTINTNGGPFQATPLGLLDLFVIEFNASGAQTFGSYIGGSKDERIMNDACVIKSNNHLFVGATTESIDILTQNYSPFSSTFDSTFNGALNDFAIWEFDQNDSLVYCSYLGGDTIDYLYGIETDVGGGIYFCGTTKSSNFPVANYSSYYHQAFYDAYNEFYGGDAIVGYIDVNLETKWSSYVGGGGNFTSNGLDIGECLVYFSQDQKLIMAGTSKSISPLYPTFNPGSPAYFQPASAFTGVNGVITEFNVSELSSIEEVNSGINKNGIVFPNPTFNKIYFKQSNISKIEIYNSIGQKINGVSTINKSGIIELDLSNLNAGLYIISITNIENGTNSYKISKL